MTDCWQYVSSNLTVDMLCYLCSVQRYAVVCYNSNIITLLAECNSLTTWIFCIKKWRVSDDQNWMESDIWFWSSLHCTVSATVKLLVNLYAEHFVWCSDRIIIWANIITVKNHPSDTWRCCSSVAARVCLRQEWKTSTADDALSHISAVDESMTSTASQHFSCLSDFL